MAELPARNAQGLAASEAPFYPKEVLLDIPGLNMANGRPWLDIGIG
jgi:hypothetical protein